MSISVIIPVYNAENFLTEAIESALSQNEVKEVILIEDGSTDGSLEICKSLDNQESRIKLFTHPNNQNLGASASRNLGLDNCSSRYIAFLDSDDFFLPARFQTAMAILDNDDSIDGVHELLGVYYQNEKAKSLYKQRFLSEVTGIQKIVLPNDLFSALASNKYGHFSLVTLTLRRSSIPKDFRFDTELLLCQDSEFNLKLAKYKKLVNGAMDRPVALRRAHEDNRVYETQKALHFKRILGYKIVEKNFYGEKSLKTKAFLLMKIISTFSIYRKVKKIRPELKTLAGFLLLFGFLILHPKILLKLVSSRDQHPNY